ncbi:MAG: DegT/DnrJ/EryC1/StrS family aminotransferase [Methanothrix sp.]|nr:DegT/DnrJ/EryC1/StrS family aminotransferase [Methanothrix sp.]
MSWDIPLFKIYWDDSDLRGINEAIKSGRDWAVGSNVISFEKGISKYIGSKYCLTFNSGTSALHAVLLAHGIGAGDEVIVPSFSFIATANAPLFVGAKPVFAEIEEETFGLSPDDVAERITNKTKAIMPIHYAGCPCKIKELKDLADDRGILLIEDAAESFGASIDGRKVGTFGDSAILSFCQNKIITTGEGGAVVTDSKEIYERLKLIRSHGRMENGDYFSSTDYMDYVTLGYNFRMPNILAALGISQLEKVERIIAMRKENAKYLSDRLKKIKEISIPIPPPGYDHVYQMYTIRLKERNEMIKHLAERSIMTKVYFDPIHNTSFFRLKQGYQTELSVTQRVSDTVLTLPMHPAIMRDELKQICIGIESFFER